VPVNAASGTALIAVAVPAVSTQTSPVLGVLGCAVPTLTFAFVAAKS
jgi:hypothetical protein